MLYPHSLLWHYLWVGPHVLQVILAIMIWRRGQVNLYPVFFAYILYEATEEFTLWTLDWLPGVSNATWWSAFCIGVIIEGLMKFAVIGEIFSHLIRSKPSVTKLGVRLIGVTGAILATLAAWAAARAPINRQFPLQSYGHIIEQTTYIIACGLLLFVFLSASRLRLIWDRWDFGIAFGSSISACVHLGTWAIVANGIFLRKGYLLDFLDMTVYHVCVLIWCYYVLSPTRPPAEVSSGIASSRSGSGTSNFSSVGTGLHRNINAPCAL